MSHRQKVRPKITVRESGLYSHFSTSKLRRGPVTKVSFSQEERRNIIMLINKTRLFFNFYIPRNSFTYFSASNFAISGYFSPVHTKAIGSPSSRPIVIATPPFAVESYFVMITASSPTASLKTSAWRSAFCPVVASITRIFL